MAIHCNMAHDLVHSGAQSLLVLGYIQVEYGEELRSFQRRIEGIVHYTKVR